MEKFKYITNATKGGEGKILLHGQIGNSIDKAGNVIYGVNGADFAAEMLFMQSICNEITVDINSKGGGVLDGYSIFAAIQDSTIPVNTVNSGLAASTALWCLAAGHEGRRSVKDYSNGMMHNSGGTKDAAVKSLIDTSINTMLSGRSGKTPEEIKAMMERETWLSADDLIKNGLADKKIPTGKTISIKKNSSLENMAEVYNKLINNEEDMTKINTLLKVSNNADDSEREAAVVSLNKSLADSTAEITDLKDKLKTLEDANTAREATEKLALKNKATAFASDLVKKGKLKKEQEADAITNLSKDQASFDFLSNVMGGATSTKESAKILDPSKIINVGGDDSSSWNYYEWEEKNPDALTNLYVTDRAAYDELFKNRPKVKTKK